MGTENLFPTHSVNFGNSSPIIWFANNTIINLNHLKNTTDTTNDELTRRSSQMNIVYELGLRDLGLIIDLQGNFTNGTLYIVNNTIYNA